MNANLQLLRKATVITEQGSAPVQANQDDLITLEADGRRYTEQFDGSIEVFYANNPQPFCWFDIEDLKADFRLMRRYLDRYKKREQGR